MGLAAFNRARKEREAQASPPKKQDNADKDQKQDKKKRTAQGDK